MKAATLSLRLPASVDRLVSLEAKRRGRSKGSVVAALTEEALKTQLFAGIAFRDEGATRRAWLVGTGWDVWQVIDVYQELAAKYGESSPKTVEELIENFGLTERQVKLAVAYYNQFPEEIDVYIRENRRPLSELKELYPFADVLQIDA